MTTESPTGISAEFQNHLRSECELKLNETVHTHPSSHFCRGTFDGWLCWADTEAGVTVHQPCPEFISGFDPTRTAYKICNKNATWFKHPISGAVWSNYTTCINHEDYNWTQQINNIYQTGYLVSFIALLLSIAILTYFKSLRCARNTLHTHMFTSFAINNLLWLLWYRLVVEHPSVVLHNGWWCQILHVVLHYFLLTNYAWMLAEGFYLHTLLVFAFTSEDTLVRWSWTLAWSTPLVVISLYTLLRISNDHTSECWINESPFTEVLVVPVCMSMALNLVFLCNIVRVLWVKLQAGPSHLSNSTPSRTLLQAFRATLLLLPLLGLHYLLTPFRPPKQHPWEPFYEVVSATTSSFQGLCVATLFCFLNGEVVAQIKRRWQFMFFRTRANSYTATTVSVRQKHIQALTAKVNRLFGNEPCDDVSSTASAWKPNDNDAQPVVSECNNNTDDRNYLFGVDWRNVSSRIANNWWIIAVSSLLPFIVFWRIQYSMRHRLQDWKKSFVQKEKAYNRSRRLTLPDLTLAKHARRESLAESTQKLTNRPKKMSHCNISQFKSIRKNSFERNEELLGDSKRVHIIRRRH